MIHRHSMRLLLCLLCLLVPTGSPAQARDAANAPAQPDFPIWTDPATGLEFVRLPGGCFLMGSPLNEPGHEPGEEQRRVCVEPFWISRTEVTRGQFAIFAEASGYQAVSTRQDWVRTWDHRWENLYGGDWRNPGMQQTDTHPVSGMSYEDAQAMARWMSRSSGRTIALPTGAQWEYAARAGTATPRWWGKAYDERVCEHANVADLSNLRDLGRKRRQPMPAAPCDDGFAHTAPVAAFQPNPWGLYDMYGNVQEWVSTDQETRFNNGHVLRGGHFLSFTTDLRAAKREDVSLEHGIYFFMGFRLVRLD